MNHIVGIHWIIELNEILNSIGLQHLRGIQIWMREFKDTVSFGHWVWTSLTMFLKFMIFMRISTSISWSSRGFPLVFHDFLCVNLKDSTKALISLMSATFRNLIRTPTIAKVFKVNDIDSFINENVDGVSIFKKRLTYLTTKNVTAYRINTIVNKTNSPRSSLWSKP